MKRTEQRRETVVRAVTVEFACDPCGRRAPIPSRGDFADDYEVKECTVEMKTGSSYPEGGDVKTTSFDVCPDCFRARLIPWMESQGAKPSTDEYDF